MRPVRTHSFNGIRYYIYIVPEGVSGLCENKPDKSHGIWIFEDIRTRDGIITVIHEGMHASQPSLSEETVDRMSREKGTLMYRKGYRWKPPK